MVRDQKGSKPSNVCTLKVLLLLSNEANKQDDEALNASLLQAFIGVKRFIVLSLQFFLHLTPHGRYFKKNILLNPSLVLLFKVIFLPLFHLRCLFYIANYGLQSPG